MDNLGHFWVYCFCLSCTPLSKMFSFLLCMSKQQELQKIDGRKQKNIGDYWHAYYSVFQIVVLNFELTPIFLLFVTVLHNQQCKSGIFKPKATNKELQRLRQFLQHLWQKPARPIPLLLSLLQGPLFLLFATFKLNNQQYHSIIIIIIIPLLYVPTFLISLLPIWVFLIHAFLSKFIPFFQMRLSSSSSSSKCFFF